MANLLFINGIGESIDLDSNEILNLQGKRGIWMPTFEFVEHDVPGMAGSWFSEVMTKPREIALPVGIQASNEAEKIGVIRNLFSILNPNKGVGRLIHTASTGSVRELNCIYAGGLEEDQAGWIYWNKGLIIFRAFDPYWYDAADISQSYIQGASESFAFFPFFPIRLSASESFAVGSVTNSGDGEAWPIWNVLGPASSITIRNLTTGELLTVNYSLDSGETMTIDTRPGRKSIKNNVGSNLFWFLSPTSSLWSFKTGVTDFRIELAGSTGSTRIDVSYRQRFLAW